MATSVKCCRKWEDLDGRERALIRWQLLHQLCHSGIPFTADRYDARGIIGQARSQGWLIEAPRTEPRLYNGLLRKR